MGSVLCPCWDLSDEQHSSQHVPGSILALELLFLLPEMQSPSIHSSDLSLKDLFSRKPFLPLRGWISSSFLCTRMKACGHLYYGPALPVSSPDYCKQFSSTI